MTKYEIKKYDDDAKGWAFPGAEFEITLEPTTEPVKLFFARRGSDFALTGVRTGGVDRFVLNGICNYCPAIDGMTDFNEQSAEKQAIIDRIEAAREELRIAQVELDGLGS